MADGAKRAEELADLLVFVSELGLFEAVGLLQTLNSPVIFGLRGKQLALGHKHRRHSAVFIGDLFDIELFDFLAQLLVTHLISIFTQHPLQA